MNSFNTFPGKSKVNPLDKNLAKPKTEISLSAFALLFSEIVQYSQDRIYTVPELQARLASMGYHIGERLLNLIFIRDKQFKRETRLINILVFIKNSVWKTLFGKEADKLEQANDDEATYYLIETEPIINKFISVPKDKGVLNCAAFICGIIEAILIESNFPAKVTVHWHKGTTFMIKFEDFVIQKDKAQNK